MKKLLLIIIAVLAFTGLSVAQDVYYCGKYENTTYNNDWAALYKNGQRLYQQGGTDSQYNWESTACCFHNNKIYWTANLRNGSEPYSAHVYENGMSHLGLSFPTAQPFIIDICFGNDNLYSVGSWIVNGSGPRRATVWKDDDWHAYYQLGNTTFDSWINAVCYGDGNLYSAGIQYTSTNTYKGVVWKNNAILFEFGENVAPVDIVYSDLEHVFYVLTEEGGYTNLVCKIYSGYVSCTAPTLEYTLQNTSSGNYYRKLCVDNDDLYASGNHVFNTRVWKNGEVIYYKDAYSQQTGKGIVANSKGVYYLSDYNTKGRVYKNSTVLFELGEDTWHLNDLFVVDECEDASARTLPFFDGFENGQTDWPCWTNIDAGGEFSIWYRHGNNSASYFPDPATGDYYISHDHGYNGLSETGWMISPKISIPSGNTTTSLSFKSYETGSGNIGTMAVKVSTTGTNPSNFTEVWRQTYANASNSWKTITVDLSAYQGQNIYIAFYYYETTRAWCVDDVSVTQTAIPQYTITANASPTNGGTVSGGGTYNQGATCTLTATPASGYEFLYWKKGNTQVSTNATYSFTVTENATYTAYFQQAAPTQYTITVNANNNAWGTVSGGGTYNSGATCTLHATPASGYQFDSWKKNGSVVSTNPNYSFTVTESATYTAYFSQEPVTYYTITTNVTPAGSGTVTGGGTYPAGSSVTLTATANNGYTFSQWQDGSTQNPRTITVNGNATYTATFTQDHYTISVYANPTNGGTVSGGGTYTYGQTCTLTATPASGYEFAGWQDGNTQNPRQITVTGNATYTANFSEVGTTYYTVSASVSPAGAGSVTGTGVYEAGSVITLQAIANTGYTFDHWSDNSTQNPRTITVNSNLNFTAYFTQNQYIITVVASPSNAGTVSGGGAYHYGDYATLSATAYSGYEFVGWSDGSTQNPHQVLVTGNATYTATFTQAGTTYYTVTTYVSPTGAGTVTGAGTYPAGATATLHATANTGYTFNRWNDGSTSNPRTVTVNNNMSFTAIFTANQYTITTNVTPAGSGTVTGGGTYNYGATATLRALPNTGYEFLQWQDGNMQNPRVITVTGNATYTALFSNGSGSMYTLTVTPNSPLLGQTFGSGTYPAGSTVEIAAYPSEYAVFVQWNDGNTQNPRTVTVSSNMQFIAEFRAAERYTLTVESANPNMGEAFGGGSFFEGTVTQIGAVAFSGYVFTGWNDGNTQNPRTVTVNSDATYRASFAPNNVVTYTLTLVSNAEQGTVSGGGVYVAGTTAIIQAFPNPGFVFTKWSDDNTENPRTLTINNDMTLVAYFATGVGENDEPAMALYPNPAKESIRIMGIEANSQIEIYNSLGELVKVMSVNPDQEIGIRDLASGLYLLRCGNATLRFVKEQ